MVVPSAPSWERRFTYASSELVDDELVDGKSIDVETYISNEGCSIEARTETLEGFSSEELKDDEE